MLRSSVEWPPYCTASVRPIDVLHAGKEYLFELLDSFHMSYLLILTTIILWSIIIYLFWWRNWGQKKLNWPWLSRYSMTELRFKFSFDWFLLHPAAVATELCCSRELPRTTVRASQAQSSGNIWVLASWACAGDACELPKLRAVRSLLKTWWGVKFITMFIFSDFWSAEPDYMIWKTQSFSYLTLLKSLPQNKLRREFSPKCRWPTLTFIEWWRQWWSGSEKGN